MKKNLIKSFALACGLLASMGVNAQNVAATKDGRVVGEKFTALGVEYEVTAVETPTCKIVGVASGATEITVASNNILPDDAKLDVFVLEGGLNNQFATAEDLEEITAVDPTPMTIPADAFAAVVYQTAYLTIPDGSCRKYAKATGWKNFLGKQTASGDIMGDLDGDEAVTLNDVAIMKNLADDGIEDGDDEYDELYDLDGDGFITLNDVAIAKNIADEGLF